MKDDVFQKRIRLPQLREKLTSAAAAAEFVKDGMTVGMSGFTLAGGAKKIPYALAERAKTEPFKITLLTGASPSNEVNRALTEAGVLARYSPFQTDRTMRAAINRGDIMYFDSHLSETGELLRRQQIAPVDVAIIEAIAITETGGIVPSTSVGNNEIFAMQAGKVIVELNLAVPLELEGVHDIYCAKRFPQAEPIGILTPSDKIGSSAIQIPPEKIVAIVVTGEPDTPSQNLPPDAETAAIAGHLIDFFKREIQHGRLTESLRPLQSGIGTIANAVMSGLATGPFSHLTMYSEVLQDSTFELIDAGMMDFASATSITLSPKMSKHVFENFGRYRDRVALRPQRISNHAEVIQRLGIITINTALEADIYGHVNSTHVMGTHMMNGIGGSGDFTHNAHTSVFVTKSFAKGGAISSIVPMVSHVDHNEHDVDILVTEVGLADLRGLAPRERAQTIINNCVEGEYRWMLADYFTEASKRGGHTPHVLEKALSWHQRMRETGTMLMQEMELYRVA
ncbi:MAG: succinate CoA transferase [Burkholderiaceae bacterium]|nr:succinate CoA transferase [Burkholderiaceae bacterium]